METKICPRCGRINSGGSLYCNACGTSLVDTPINQNKDIDIISKPRDILGLLGEVIAKYLLLVTVILVALGILLIVWTFGLQQESVVYFIVSEIGKAIVITGLVTGITKWYLTRQYTNLIRTGQRMYEEGYKQELQTTLERVENRILDQTQRIASYASSLDSMQKADIVRLYESRNKASSDIRVDLQDPSVTSMRIIGVSLNDFLRPGSGDFHQAWRTIEHHITGEQPVSHPLNIRALLIDPTCYGAYHRSKAEETKGVGIAGRLESDVMDSIKALDRLEQQASRQGDGVHFEIKLYRTPPILSLVQTDFVSYVQQYHFWPQYDPNLNIPVIRYQGRRSSDTQGRSMHDEMQFHFDYIWENCSVSIHEYTAEAARGCDDAIRQANIGNIYYDPGLCEKRILNLMNATNERLYIKGITLNSFFKDGELFNVFCRVATRKGIRVRILLIDPDSEQAKVRSFREYLLKNPDGKWEDFCDKDLHKDQMLYSHTQQSIGSIRGFLRELEDKNIQHNIVARMFSSAPECFMLMTDQSVLLEQYHYGKIRPPREEAERIQPKILGRDVPVLEYMKPSSQALHEFPLRNMYRILEDHFDFVSHNFTRDIT